MDVYQPPQNQMPPARQEITTDRGVYSTTPLPPQRTQPTNTIADFVSAKESARISVTPNENNPVGTSEVMSAPRASCVEQYPRPTIHYVGDDHHSQGNIQSLSEDQDSQIVHVTNQYHSLQAPENQAMERYIDPSRQSRSRLPLSTRDKSAITNWLKVRTAYPNCPLKTVQKPFDQDLAAFLEAILTNSPLDVNHIPVYNNLPQNEQELCLREMIQRGQFKQVDPLMADVESNPELKNLMIQQCCLYGDVERLQTYCVERDWLDDQVSLGSENNLCLFYAVQNHQVGVIKYISEFPGVTLNPNHNPKSSEIIGLAQQNGRSDVMEALRRVNGFRDSPIKKPGFLQRLRMKRAKKHQARTFSNSY